MFNKVELISANKNRSEAFTITLQFTNPVKWSGLELESNFLISVH